jgi:hypothetical protein
MPSRSVTGFAIVLLFGLATCGPEESASPAIPFAPLVDTALKDPDNPAKIFHVDFAEVEQKYPLSRSHLTALTPENIKTLPQEKIDQIYARITAGPLPVGSYRSAIFFAPGGNLKDRVEELIGGFRGRLAGVTIDTLLLIVGAVWTGKTFYHDQGVARTAIEDVAPLMPLLGNSESIPTESIPRQGPLRFVLPEKKAWMLFPAKYYCGQSLIDGRRESVVIDYNYGEDTDGYRANPDALTGRGGMQLRDEIRMVRPGFYLGRAYVGRMFLLDFTLYDESLAERERAGFAAGQPVIDDCWTGEQATGGISR